MAKRKETVEKKEVIEFPMDKKFICLIINEDSQGKPVELKGYYSPDVQLITQAMRPSKTFNTLLKSIA